MASILEKANPSLSDFLSCQWFHGYFPPAKTKAPITEGTPVGAVPSFFTLGAAQVLINAKERRNYPRYSQGGLIFRPSHPAALAFKDLFLDGKILAPFSPKSQ